jgi:hypothetical protein
VKAEDEVSALRADVVDLRIEARHARDREAAAKAKLEAALNAPVDAREASGGRRRGPGRSGRSRR